MMDQIIYFFGSGILFFNKVLLQRKDNRGWLLGIVGVLLISIPTYKNHLMINMGFHLGLLVLMTYGYLLTHNLRGLVPKVIQTGIKIIIICATLFFCVYLYITTLNSKKFNELQLVQSISALLGALFLAINLREINIMGWISNIASHICSAYLWYHLDFSKYWSIVLFQLLSIIVSIYAIKKEIEQNREAS